MRAPGTSGAVTREGEHTMSEPRAEAAPQANPFVDTLLQKGMEPVVAEELERRIQIIESDEADDVAHRALTPVDIAVYLLVCAGICAVALGVLA